MSDATTNLITATTPLVGVVVGALGLFWTERSRKRHDQVIRGEDRKHRSAERRRERREGYLNELQWRALHLKTLTLRLMDHEYKLKRISPEVVERRKREHRRNNERIFLLQARIASEELSLAAYSLTNTAEVAIEPTDAGEFLWTEAECRGYVVGDFQKFQDSVTSLLLEIDHDHV